MSLPPDEADEGPLDVTTLEQALSSLLSYRGLTGAAVLSAIFSAWDKVAGPELAAKARPVALRGRELVLEVPSPPWATQLNLLSSELVTRLNQELGKEALSGLSVRVNPRSGQ
jgi:predicted nucleic acid-binding Zn ribbon protein